MDLKHTTVKRASNAFRAAILTESGATIFPASGAISEPILLHCCKGAREIFFLFLELFCCTASLTIDVHALGNSELPLLLSSRSAKAFFITSSAIYSATPGQEPNLHISNEYNVNK